MNFRAMCIPGYSLGQTSYFILKVLLLSVIQLYINGFSWEQEGAHSFHFLKISMTQTQIKSYSFRCPPIFTVSIKGWFLLSFLPTGASTSLTKSDTTGGGKWLKEDGESSALNANPLGTGLPHTCACNTVQEGEKCSREGSCAHKHL